MRTTNERMLNAANIGRDFQNTRTLLEIGKKLYLDAVTADVFFVTPTDDGSSKRIPAHKALLAATSDVFHTMFFGQLQEIGDVKVEDTTAAIFEEFLQFFYVETVTLTMDNVAGVIYLGHKYNVIDCFNSGLEVALLYDLADLKKKCEAKISKVTDAVLKSASFLQCDKRALNHILNMDVLSCTEKFLFKACMRWVQHCCTTNILSRDIVRNCLGDAFYDIRFASMKFEELADIVNEFGHLFTGTESKELIQLVALPNYKAATFTTKLRTRPQCQQLLGDDAK
ncbi:hypothetical protein HA402_001724 [Bradysia odoriphaga]|nr:hypothetical protein HA402_001724 [Bradysia odoriphaga]